MNENFSCPTSLPPAEAAQALCELSNQSSLELLPLKSNIKKLDWMEPGVEVFITFLPLNPEKPYEEEIERRMRMSLNTAEAARNHGLKPVMHVPARAFDSVARLERFIGEARDRAKVESALILAGDYAAPRCTELENSLDILKTDVLRQNYYRNLYAAAHPEGFYSRVSRLHISQNELDPFIIAKRDYAQQNGMSFGLVSQFSLRPEMICAYESRIRALCPAARFKVGVPSPSRMRDLMRYAYMLGVLRLEDPMGFVRLMASQNIRNLAWRSMTGRVPLHDRIFMNIAKHRAAHEGSLITSMHFYAFGGLRQTEHYRQILAKGSFQTNPDGTGYRLIENLHRRKKS